MLSVLNDSRVKIDAISKYKDYHIEKTLDSTETLYFSYPIQDDKTLNLKIEYYIQNSDNRYVIKEQSTNGDFYDYVCILDLEDFKSDIFEFNNISGTITDIMDYFLTIINESLNASHLRNWTASYDTVLWNDTRERTIDLGETSFADFITSLIETFFIDAKIDVVNQVIYLYNKMGSDKGTYFIENLNLQKLDTNKDGYDLVTELEPRGKDGLTIYSVNANGYVSNYTYTNKKIRKVWVDERYTSAAILAQDAALKLTELAKPQSTYKASVIDLASSNPIYKDILSYGLGDTVILMNKYENQKQTHRIVVIDIYPDEPQRNTAELSSKSISIESIQKGLLKTQSTVDNITTPSGNVKSSAVQQSDDTMLPLIVCGTVTISTSGGIGSANITFSGFSENPLIFACAQSAAPGTYVKEASAIANSTTSGTVYLNRSDSSPTPVSWMAIGI